MYIHPYHLETVTKHVYLYYNQHPKFCFQNYICNIIRFCALKACKLFELILPVCHQLLENSTHKNQRIGGKGGKKERNLGNTYLLYNSIAVKPIQMEEHRNSINLQAIYSTIPVKGEKRLNLWF